MESPHENIRNEEQKDIDTLKSKLESQLEKGEKYDAKSALECPICKFDYKAQSRDFEKLYLESQQQIKELHEMCNECDMKYEELWSSNWKLKAVIDDIKEWSDSYSSGYDQYDYEKAKHHELKEILKKVESK
jgi:chromosome segregation ATPase